MAIGERAKSVMERLIPLYQEHPQGGMAIDTEKVTEVVRSDPQAVLFGVRKALDSGFASQFGWGFWLAVACVFDQEFDDDSLVIAVKSAAAQAGESLPSIKVFSPHGTGNETRQKKRVILQMAESDVRDCDAFRLIKLLGLDALAPHVREQMFGNCIVTFPADGDPRPVQHIPSIRAFVNKLHSSIPHFPLFLDLDPKLGMWMVYFGCLADAEATTVVSDHEFIFYNGHPSVLAVIRPTLSELRRACEPRQIDWMPCAEAIVQPFEHSTRVELLQHAKKDRM